MDKYKLGELSCTWIGLAIYWCVKELEMQVVSKDLLTNFLLTARNFLHEDKIVEASYPQRVKSYF